MPSLCVINPRGPSMNDLVQLLFVVCIFPNFLSHVEPMRQSAVLKVGGEYGSPINGTEKAPRIEKTVTVRESLALGQECSPRDISVTESPIYPFPDGIPAFAVEIINTCITGCTISNIHIRCGSFASTIEINPSIFRRLAYDDCLVNDGGNLAAGDTVSFVYANSFMYPLSVASVDCPGD